MASPDFKGLLFSLSQKLNQQEVAKLVAAYHLPNGLKDQPPNHLLRYLERNGQIAPSSLEWLEKAMKGIGKNDLYKEIKVFVKAEKKIRKRPTSSSVSSQSEAAFDAAECQAVQMEETLRAMEATVKTSDVKGIEELYNEAKTLAESLVQAVKRMNSLARCPSPPEQNSTPDKASSNTLPRRSRNGSTPPSATPIVRVNRSFSEKNFSVVRPLPPSQPPLPIIPFEHASDNDEEPAHDYDLPTNFGVATLDQSSLDRAAREVLNLDPTSVTASQESAPRNKVQGGNGKSKGSPPPVKQKVKDKTRKTSVPTSVASHITGSSRLQSAEPACSTSPQSSSEIYQIRKNLRRTVQKYDTQSSGGTASHPSHPISTARAVECVDHSDVSGDSGFCDEFYPVKNGTLPTPTPKPKPRLQMNSDMDYVNCVPPQFCQDLCSSEVLEEDAHDYINVESYVM